MKKRKLAAITILAAALCLSGCGGSSSSNGAYYKEQAAGSSYEESYAREDAMMAAEAESADAAAGDYAGDYTADGGETDSRVKALEWGFVTHTRELVADSWDTATQPLGDGTRDIFEYAYDFMNDIAEVGGKKTAPL